MSFPSPRDGLSLDQAPPLAIPGSFFLLAPVAIAAAGLLLIGRGAEPLGSGSRPGSLALAHLGTLGVVGSVMLGALYQMAPVIAGARVPAIRLAYGVHLAWMLGVAALVAGFLTGRPTLFLASVVGLGVALTAFVLPLAVGLARAPTRTWTVHGMRVALAGLVVATGLGLAFATLRAGRPDVTTLPGFDLGLWRIGHFMLGLIAWIGALLAAVTWQVLPMFYLSSEVPKGRQAAVAIGAGVTLLGTVAVLLSGGSRTGLLLALAPGALAAWVVHPALSLPRLRARQRTRWDETVRAWMAALACAVAVALCAPAALWLGPRWGVAFVWLAVWGWAGFAVHGMLCRIVPFLVWFHRLSPLVGKAAVPPVRRLMPQDRILRALQAHGLALALGLVAIGAGWDPVARLAGLALVVAAGLLGRNLVDVLAFWPPVGAQSQGS